MMLRALFLLSAVAVVADPRCVSCHQSIVESYARTGKARSVGKPRAEVQPQRQWFHEFSGRRMGVTWGQGKMTHFMEMKGAVESYEVEWGIGSGREAKNFVVRLGDSLFMSPLAWFAHRMIWDMAPGYAIDANPTFYRPVSGECLQCHAGRVEAVEGSQNRFGAFSETAIGCERCHGDVSAHLAAAAKGNVVNPVRLAAAKRDAVCEACHLPGEARVANPGKKISDFRPGMGMEDVFTIYVSRRNSEDTVLRVNSHSEEWAESKCTPVWCGTCHDSHGAKVDVREKCLGCHTSMDAHRKKAGADCVGCHMPKQRPWDGSHTSRTDHWIRTAKSEQKFLDRGELLRAWREPAAEVATRNLALGYLQSAEKTRSLKRLREGLVALDSAVKQGHTDGDVALAAGLQYVRQKKADLALPWLRRAVELAPLDSLRRLHLAAALANTGLAEEARKEAVEAVRLEPLLEQSYVLLGQIEPARKEYWKDQYRKVVPKRVVP